MGTRSQRRVDVAVEEGGVGVRVGEVERED